jgi:hypothetical protein
MKKSSFNILEFRKEFNDSSVCFLQKDGEAIRNCSKGIDYLIKTTEGNDNNSIKDRLERADAHMLSSMNFLISSYKALRNKDYLMFNVSLYYSLFNLLFSYLCLDMSIKNNNLKWIRHSKIPKLLGKHINEEIIQKRVLNIFEQMRETREKLSYLSSPTSLGKFEIMSKKEKYYIIRTDENYKIKKKVNLTLFEYCFISQELLGFNIADFILFFKNYEKILNSKMKIYDFKFFCIINSPNTFIKNYFITSDEDKKSRREMLEVKSLSRRLCSSIDFIISKIKQKEAIDKNTS